MASSGQDPISYEPDATLQYLRGEFSDIRTLIENLRTDVFARLSEVHVDTKRNEVTSHNLRSIIEELRVDTKRNEATSHNARLTKPFQLLKQVPAYNRQRGGLVWPDVFPRDVNEFLGLRRASPDSERTLGYLVGFYDIPKDLPPDKVVDILANIIGLNEDYFVNPNARDSPNPPVSRQIATRDVAEGQSPDWPALAINADIKPTTRSDPSSFGRVLWVQDIKRGPTLRHPNDSGDSQQETRPGTHDGAPTSEFSSIPQRAKGAVAETVQDIL